MPTINWTGRRSTGNGLLNLNYTNVAEVMHYSEMVGKVYALTDGYYHPAPVGGGRLDICATPDQAARALADFHDKEKK